ncbi:MAG: hypothetical protein ACYC8T_29915, partial [Myxococcaceae bacterium]
MHLRPGGRCEALVCAPPPNCVDGAKNGLESDVDCGGPACAPCVVGRVCLTTDDCASHDCRDNFLETDATWKQTL